MPEHNTGHYLGVHQIGSGPLSGLGRAPRKEREEQRRRQDGKREKRS